MTEPLRGTEAPVKELLDATPEAALLLEKMQG